VTVTLTLTHGTTLSFAVAATDLVSVTVPHSFENDNDYHYDNISNQQDLVN